jgi:hypothetical protein
VNDQNLKFGFGIGLIHRSIPLNQIIEAKAVRNPLWSGWGIRMHPAYTLYNVSGFEAVELTLKGKRRKVRIGTNVAQELSQYINEKVVSR